MSGPASSFAASLVLADIDSNALQVARDELRAEGHEVVTQVTDVSDRE